MYQLQKYPVSELKWNNTEAPTESDSVIIEETEFEGIKIYFNNPSSQTIDKILNKLLQCSRSERRDKINGKTN